MSMKPDSDKIQDRNNFYLELEIRLKLLENQNSDLENPILINNVFKKLSSKLRQKLFEKFG